MQDSLYAFDHATSSLAPWLIIKPTPRKSTLLALELLDISHLTGSLMCAERMCVNLIDIGPNVSKHPVVQHLSPVTPTSMHPRETLRTFLARKTISVFCAKQVWLGAPIWMTDVNKAYHSKMSSMKYLPAYLKAILTSKWSIAHCKFLSTLKSHFPSTTFTIYTVFTPSFTKVLLQETVTYP